MHPVWEILLTLLETLLRALLTLEEDDVVVMTPGHVDSCPTLLAADVTAGCDVTGGVSDAAVGCAVSSLTSIGELVVGDSRPLSLALSTTAAARSEQQR